MTKQSSFIKNRIGKIGASEISGLVAEYSSALLQKNVIDQEIYDKLIDLPAYLDTKYSLAHKLSFDYDKLNKYSEFISNDAMQRGKDCEEMVMQHFLEENEGFKVLDEQINCMKELEGVDIPMIATLDYIIEKDGKKYIHECKTTDIDRWEFNVGDQPPFNYVIQVNQQMFFNDISEAFITIAGVKTIKDKKKRYYQILEQKTFKVEYNPILTKAVNYSMMWLDYELKNDKESIFNKDETHKTKADIEIDSFLQDLEQTICVDADQSMDKKIQRLNYLKGFMDEFKILEKEVKADISNFMQDKKKIKIAGKNIHLVAKYTKPTFYTQDLIIKEIATKEKALEEAKNIRVDTPKSKPYLRYEIVTN